MTDAVLSLDNALKLLEIGSILGAGAIVVFRLGRTSKSVEESAARFQEGMKMQAVQINSLQDEVKALGKVVTEVAVQNQRIDTQDKRLDSHDRRIEELSHGEGFVFPLAAHLHGGAK